MHTIRLRHPWQAAWRDQPAGDVPALSVPVSSLPIPSLPIPRIPAPSLTPTARHYRLAIYSRQFHRPSGLSEDQPVTLILQPTSPGSFTWHADANLPQSARAVAQAPSQPTDARNTIAAAAGTLSVQSILLNSQPLSLCVATDDAQLVTHMSVRIESLLESFNQLEVLCCVAADEAIDNSIAVSTAATAWAPAPPALAQWSEVRLEIND